MADLNTYLAIGLGLVIRIGLPIAITGLVIFFLRKLDNRWQAEAKACLQIQTEAGTTPCWEVKKCETEQMKTCPVVQQNESLCWQLYRTEQGALKDICLGCDVFRQAPLPTGKP